MLKTAIITSKNNINPSPGNIHQIIGHYNLSVLFGAVFNEECLYMVHFQQHYKHYTED